MKISNEPKTRVAEQKKTCRKKTRMVFGSIRNHIKR